MARKDMEHYKRWKAMKCRCYNPNHTFYKNYGGRGITICDEWKNDFMCFYEWASQSGYKKGLTLDRIDNNKGYSPQNCRWVTRKEQGRNQRTNHKITINGETRLLCEWEEISGISSKNIIKRLRRGWKNNDLIKPLKTNTHYITYNGETHTIAEWSRKLNVPHTTISGRIRKGMSPFENHSRR